MSEDAFSILPNDKSRKYIVVTPAKNEEKNITKCVECVVNQRIRPSLWVIIDDGSTDRTSEIIREAEKKYSYIKRIKLPKGKRNLGLHYAYICKQGFGYAIDFCEKKDIDWNYISLLDADIQLEEEYFEKLIMEFEKNLRLGIASGDIYYQTDAGLRWEKTRRDLPRGANRVWRRKCFEETNGYTITYSPDSVSTVKAKIRGWKTRQFKDIIAIQTRATSSAEGLWKGYFENGCGDYYLNHPPLLMMLKTLKYLLKPKFYLAFAYFIGHLSSSIRKESRIKDEEIKNYFRKQRLKELIDIYLAKNRKV